MNNAAVSNLVYISNNQPMTDSKKLSEAVGIRHADVLRKIETILTNTSNDFKERNFVKLNIIEENAIGKKTSHSYGKTKPSSDKEPFIYSSKEILKDYDLEHTLNKYSDKLKNESDSPTYLDSPGKILTYMLKAQHSLTSRTYNPKGVAVFRRSEVESLMSSLKISRIIA